MENGLGSSSKHLFDHACREHWASNIAYATAEYMMQAADVARVKGHHDAATGYFNRVHDYVLHFISKEKQIFRNDADPLAFTFKINLERSLNWLEQGSYEDALGACEIALEIANELFLTHPALRLPPVDHRGRITKGKQREWTCECIKEGAAAFGQRIKCDEIGQAYYYYSISGHLVNGEEATEEAYDDRALGIALCVVSETNPGDLPNEL